VAQKDDDARAEENAEYISKFRARLVAGLTLLPLLMWLWPGLVPFGFWEFWRVRGTPLEWLRHAWPAFAWGGGLTLLVALATRNERHVNRFAERIIREGAKTSVFAGVVEEIAYRWLFFLWSIIAVQWGNWLFFGWAGFGLAQWLHLHAFGPLADWTTLGHLHGYLFHPAGWAVGAAMLAANGFFRDGHKYLGLFGFLNSWFMGMFFFWVLFTYGLVPAILIHFAYDFIIFAVRYLDAVVERAQGHA
jgi:hypothetical protein